jgi:type I restriction enzyme R subunit
MVPARGPHIAISVDMLDTGIDVPEIVNLVFFKMVRSKTKFWQMVGRGTRLRPDLFGPGKDKKFFYIFDYCQNLEFFSQNPETTSGAAAESLGKKLFASRVELIAELDKLKETDLALRDEVAERLRKEVELMNLDNFIVRPKRRLIEKYKDAAAWQELGLEQRGELTEEVAGLPSELVDDEQEAKQFDLLMLRLQLALLRHDRRLPKLIADVKEIAGALNELTAIPIVRAELELIIEVQTDEFWQDVTPPMLENVRKRLRSLVKFIEVKKRPRIYTDFEDLMGDATEIELGVGGMHDEQRFREKTEQFLRAHAQEPVIVKMRFNEALTPADLETLEQMLVKAGTGSTEDIQSVKLDGGLGLFVRRIVGLDREAAKKAMDGFLTGKTLNSTQIQFVNQVIEYLTQSGWMDAGQLYESPFTDFSPKGVEGVFSGDQVQQLIGVLSEVRQRAIVAA